MLFCSQNIYSKGSAPTTLLTQQPAAERVLNATRYSKPLTLSHHMHGWLEHTVQPTAVTAHCACIGPTQGCGHTQQALSELMRCLNASAKLLQAGKACQMLTSCEKETLQRTTQKNCCLKASSFY
jgi:hypothetical protein